MPETKKLTPDVMGLRPMPKAFLKAFDVQIENMGAGGATLETYAPRLAAHNIVPHAFYMACAKNAPKVALQILKAFPDFDPCGVVCDNITADTLVAALKHDDLSSAVQRRSGAIEAAQAITASERHMPVDTPVAEKLTVHEEQQIPAVPSNEKPSILKAAQRGMINARTAAGAVGNAHNFLTPETEAALRELDGFDGKSR